MLLLASALSLSIYGLGGAADVWSTRRVPLGYVSVDRSPYGPIVGPMVTSACFVTADALLVERGHRGWARALRVAYVAGITVIVVRNHQMHGRMLMPGRP